MFEGKSSRVPLSKDRDRAVRVLEIIDSDVMGPLSPARTSEKYIILFIDGFSNCSVYVTKARNIVISCFKDFCKIMLAKFPGIKIAVLRADNAREYTWELCNSIVFQKVSVQKLRTPIPKNKMVVLNDITVFF